MARLAPMLLATLALGGCTGPGNLRGSWSGDCDFSDGSYGGPIFLDLEVSTDLGRRITGTGVATLPADGIFDLTLEGERAGEYAILDMHIDSPSGELLLIFEGQRDADELEGSCELWVPGASAPIVGTGEIER